MSKVGAILAVLDGWLPWRNASQPRYIGKIEKVAAAFKHAVAEDACRLRLDWRKQTRTFH